MTQLGDIITGGTQGATDGLAAIDPSDVAGYDNDKFNDALGACGAGVVTALDGINRENKGKITPAVFISIKDSTTTSIVSYGSSKGYAKWGNGGGTAGGGLRGKVCGRAIGSIKNVTSIANFDPVAAIGNFFCTFFSSSQSRCVISTTAVLYR